MAKRPNKNGTPTKELLLNSAASLFFTKGVTQTRILDILNQTGSSPNTLYAHFKSKEELLLAIPREKATEIRKINEDHLRGLEGAEVKLRKLIWNYMEFALNNKETFALFLFEIRSNRSYYTSKTYDFVKNFTNMYRDVIIEGQRDKIFRPDVSPSMVLNLIFGTIDNILITWIIEDRPKNPLDLFEDFLDLLIHSIGVKKTERNHKDKRARILNSAKSIFAQIGFKKARVQDIAKNAGVGDGTIYKYFASKDEILFTLADEKAKYVDEQQGKNLTESMPSDLKLETMLRDYIQNMSLDMELWKIFQFDLRYNLPFYKTKTYGVHRRFTRTYYDILVQGIEDQRFKQTINPYLVGKMIFGIIDHTFLSSSLFGHPKKISDASDSIIKLIMNAIK